MHGFLEYCFKLEVEVNIGNTNPPGRTEDENEGEVPYDQLMEEEKTGLQMLRVICRQHPEVDSCNSRPFLGHS